MMYVDLDNMKIVSRDVILKKAGGAKAANVPLSAGDLAMGNAAELDESATGDVATGFAVLNSETGTYQREYRNLSAIELESQERNWRDAQFAPVEIAMNRVQDNHNSEVGLVGEWRTYRNELRDYPQGVGFPDRTLNPRPVEPE